MEHSTPIIYYGSSCLPILGWDVTGARVLSCPSRVSFYGKGPGAVSLIGHVLMVLLLRGFHSGEFVCLSAYSTNLLLYLSTSI
jgi:hypothetical protein